MNEYKELIGLLTHPADGRDNADIMISAADAIDQLSTKCRQLEKERDAAVADIQTACGYCKWFRDCGDGECFCPKPCENISGVNTMWEWRGVQDEVLNNG